MKALLPLLGGLASCGAAPATEAVPPSCHGEGPLEIPCGFPPPRIPAAHPITTAGVAVGRRLFFDPRLSSTGAVSCATCHDPRFAFSVPQALPRVGVSGRAAVRHPPALVNLAWADTGLFWDGGAKNLESQAFGPLLNPDEMGRTDGLDSLIDELRDDEEYEAAFEAAFGSGGVTAGHIVDALAQFERSLVSASSRWDLRREGRTSFSREELIGEATFDRACRACHTPPLFTDRSFHNNGIDADFPAKSDSVARGRARISGRATDVAKFKTPTLRNLARSAPYMHDGRFPTIDDVIEHYRHGILPSRTLDPGLTHDGYRGLSMSDEEAAGLRAFLLALTDLPDGDVQ